MKLGQRIIDAILRPFFALLLPYDVEGTENLPVQGPAIVMINHINFSDVVVPGMFLPRDVVMMSKIENFRVPVLGLFVRAYEALPVHRGQVDMEAMRLALGALKRGEVLVIAPEGTRSKDGRLLKGHDGLAFVALQSGAPVVPMAMYGHESLGRNLKRLRRTPFHVRVGKPFRFTAHLDSARGALGRLRRADLHAMTQEAMYRLAALLPPGYRGAYVEGAPAAYELTEPWPAPGAGGTA